MNKRAWLARLEETTQLATRHALPTSVLMLDLDHFKAVNDTYGHLVGDRVLATVSGCLVRHLRRSDVAGRYGGEELVVLLPHTPAAGALIIAERLRSAIAELAFISGGQAVSLTVSVGVASLLSNEGQVPEDVALDLLSRADQALYQAKHQGRNRVMQSADAAAR